MLMLLFCLLPLTALAAKNPFFSGSTEAYPHPLYFDLSGSEVELEPLQLSYNLSNGALEIGTLKMQPGDFYIDLLTLKKANSSLTEDVFVVQWPEYFMRDGNLEIISRTGRTLWSANINEKRLEEWRSSLGSWKTKAQYGVRNANPDNTPLWRLNEPFRVCLTKGKEGLQTRLCSTQFRMELIKGKARIFKVPLSNQPPRVIVNNQQSPLQQAMPVKPGEAVQFYAELSDGSSYEFYAIPKTIAFVDMVGDEQQTWALAITEGEAPLQPTEIINKEKSSRFVEFLGWQQTIGDFRQYWRTKIPFGETQILLPGNGGGAFLQKMKIKTLPTEKMRAFLEPEGIEGTYVDGSRIFFKKSPQTQVSSKQNRVFSEEENSEEFGWEFGAKKRGQMNRSYLLVSDGTHTFKAYHELFKGFPREISLRSILIPTSVSDYAILGEIAFSYWFEDVLGWDNTTFSKQRWGLSTKYFRTLNDLKHGGVSGPFNVLNAELKYRLTSGMWARKETWGLIAGYQKFEFSPPVRTFEAELLGVGVFWARSMPRIFDKIINYFPFMNYPKWVDAEFIYYPMTSSPGVEVGVNYALNFHGQVMWSDRFFGEAGFGIKGYDYAKQLSATSKPRFTFTSLYGTVGLGYRF